MIMSSRKVYAVVIAFILLGCSGSGDPPETAENQSENTQPSASVPIQTIAESNISPNHCRIIGTIVAIDETLTSLDSSNPCSKAPCRATVRIESVIGYGSAFGAPLATGRDIEVSFRFTLNPTKDLIPNMTEDYPGLQVNSRFLADVESIEVMAQEKEGGIEYVIYGYEIK